MGLFPMFTKLEGRKCLVAGAGTVGEGKIASLLEAGAAVTVAAPKATALVTEWAQQGIVAWHMRLFASADLDDVFLVVVATNSTDANRAIFEEAQRRGVLCNVVDDPEYCDFYYPAVVRRGNLQIAVSTGGLSPALAQRIRKDLEPQFPLEYAEWLEAAAKMRRGLLAADLNSDLRRAMLHESVSAEAFAGFVRERRENTLERGDV